MADTATAPAGAAPVKTNWIKKPAQWRVYKPNKTNTGAASRIEMKIVPKAYGQKEVQLFLVSSPQDGIDKDGNASFTWKAGAEDKRSVTMKLGETDIGEFLAVLNGRKDAVGSGKGLFHQNDKGNTSLTFGYNSEYKLYNFRIAKKGSDGKIVEVKHSISIGEGEILRALLERAVITKYDW